MKRFTFKTEKPTGRYRSFYEPIHYIKFKKIKIGYIDNKNFNIHLKVIKKDINEDGNSNCKWKWITLRKSSNSLQETKDCLNKYIDKIFEKYDIFLEGETI